MKSYFNVDYDLCTKLHLKIEGQEKKNWESLQMHEKQQQQNEKMPLFRLATLPSVLDVMSNGIYCPRKPQGLLGMERWGQGVMEVGEEGDYIPIATLSPPE